MRKPQEFSFADPAALNPMTTPPLPEQIELHRDRMWRRDEDLRVEMTNTRSLPPPHAGCPRGDPGSLPVLTA